MSDIDTAAADSLKVLDPERPIREADMAGPAAGSTRSLVRFDTSGKAFLHNQDPWQTFMTESTLPIGRRDFTFLYSSARAASILATKCVAP